MPLQGGEGGLGVQLGEPDGDEVLYPQGAVCHGAQHALVLGRSIQLNIN